MPQMPLPFGGSTQATLSTPILGPNTLNTGQITAWMGSVGHTTVNTSATVPQLAAWYLAEGAAQGVRGDIAFAQACLETGYFTSPATAENNFAGIGISGPGVKGYSQPNPRLGVRMHIQLLAKVVGGNLVTLAYPNISPAWGGVTITTWGNLGDPIGGSGHWAGDPTYGSKIISIFNQMLGGKVLAGIGAGAAVTPVLSDTIYRQAMSGGSLRATSATAVGFDPQLDPSALILNGQQVDANVAHAVTSIELHRTVNGASTLTLTVEDPDRTLLRSGVFTTAQPGEPITVVTPQITTTAVNASQAATKGLVTGALLNLIAHNAAATATVSSEQVTGSTSKLSLSNASYYPTTVALTDGTTLLQFALVAIQKTGDTLTVTFEDQLINQLRYVYNVTGLAVTSGTQTRAQYMAQVVLTGMRQLVGNVIQPKLCYPSSAVPGVDPVMTATDLLWGGPTNPDQDGWSLLVQAANVAQWRCFSTGTTLVWGPDSWLLGSTPAVSFAEYAGGVKEIDAEYDIGQAISSLTVNMADTTAIKCSQGSIGAVTGLGPELDGNWILSDLERELHLPDGTVTLSQAMPALTEQQIAATVGTVSTITGTNASGQSVTYTNPTGTLGESQAAIAAVKFAVRQVGKPYVTGGTGPGGYDCSGLCYAAYLSAGVTIPRTSEAQWQGLPHVSMSQILPGDLVFYNDNYYANPGHVVLYIGNGQCVQAEMTGTNVMVTPLPGGYYSDAARPT